MTFCEEILLSSNKLNYKCSLMNLGAFNRCGLSELYQEIIGIGISRKQLPGSGEFYKLSFLIEGHSCIMMM